MQQDFNIKLCEPQNSVLLNVPAYCYCYVKKMLFSSEYLMKTRKDNFGLPVNRGPLSTTTPKVCQYQSARQRAPLSSRPHFVTDLSGSSSQELPAETQTPASVRGGLSRRIKPHFSRACPLRPHLPGGTPILRGPSRLFGIHHSSPSFPQGHFR